MFSAKSAGLEKTPIPSSLELKEKETMIAVLRPLFGDGPLEALMNYPNNRHRPFCRLEDLPRPKSIAQAKAIMLGIERYFSREAPLPDLFSPYDRYVYDVGGMADEENDSYIPAEQEIEINKPPRFYCHLRLYPEYPRQKPTNEKLQKEIVEITSHKNSKPFSSAFDLAHYEATNHGKKTPS